MGYCLHASRGQVYLRKAVGAAKYGISGIYPYAFVKFFSIKERNIVVSGVEYENRDERVENYELVPPEDVPDFFIVHIIVFQQIRQGCIRESSVRKGLIIAEFLEGTGVDAARII